MNYLNLIYFKLQHEDLSGVCQSAWENQISSLYILYPPRDSILLQEWGDDFNCVQTKNLLKMWQVPLQAPPQ